MYESPIRLIVQELETSIREQQEKQIFEAVQKCGVDVDREELIKALAYDRDQYGKGYADGRADAQRWISVEEMLPEDYVSVIGYLPIDDKEGYPPAREVYRTEKGWFAPAFRELCIVTHWMPLPTMPKEACP